jgi:prepilin-type N-terminal cleavage/methylation domain-containing protein
MTASKHNQSMNNYRYFRIEARQRGFTLVELLVTLAVFAILVGLAAPQLRTLLIRRTVSSQAESLSAGLRLARSEAIKRGQYVTMCASNNAESATPTCLANGASDWGSGWIVFVASPANIRQFVNGNVLLKVANGAAMLNSASTFTILPKMNGTPADLQNYIACVKLAPSGRTQTYKPDTKGGC